MDFSNSTMINAVLDEGSGASFITLQLAESLGLDLSQEQTRSLHFLGAAVRVNNFHVPSLFVRNVLTGDIFEVSVSTIESIPKGIRLPDFESLKARFSNLAALPVPQQKPPTTSVDILFGLDNYHLMSCIQELPFTIGEPCARRSPLGWTVSYASTQDSSTPVTLTQVDPVSPINYTVDLVRLDRLLLDFFDLEKSLVTFQDVELLSAEEKNVQDRVATSAVQLKDKHYMVRVPWKRNCPTYPQNRKAVMLQQQNHVEFLRKKNPDILASVASQFQDFHNRDWTEPLDPGDLTSQDGFWLCWFVVTCLHKSTPHRIVFDCARKFLGICLNDGIHPGPKTQNDISMILFAFRLNPVAVAADVSKMYMQFKMYPEDRVLHRFVDEQGKWWQFKSHIFGNTASPYVCISTMMNHIKAHASPELYDKVKNCFYVDDLLIAFKDVQEARTVVAELVKILDMANLPLRKFVSNSADFWSSLTEPLQEKSFSLTNPDVAISALGLKWLPNPDIFTFSAKLVDQGEPTKRKMASVVASIYDPLGFIVAFTFLGAKILQDIHRLSKSDKLQISWDTVLSPSLSAALTSILKRWKLFLADLARLDLIRIRRQVSMSADNIVSIHIFSDGSDAAYAFTAYALTLDGDAPQLVAGAKRLTSLTPRTIPEIELQGVCLATKFADKLRLHFGLRTFHFWTDSLPVLYWLNNPNNKLKVFVMNRLIQVRRNVSSLDFKWHFVPGDINPADKPTRGLVLDKLLEDETYWHGPAFLRQPEDSWPKIPFVLLKGELLNMEVVPVLLTNKGEPARLTLRVVVENFFTWNTDHFDQSAVQSDAAVSALSWGRVIKDLIEVDRFSKIKKLVGTVNKVFHFFATMLALDRPVNLGLNPAWAGVLKWAQLSSFEAAIKTFIEDDKWPKTYGFSGLNIAFDRNGVLRVYGRWASDMTRPPQNRHPILLRADSPIVILIADQTHHEVGHGCSVWQLRARLQETYFIIRIQPLCRLVLSRCIKCQKIKKAASTQLMSQPNHDPSLWELCRPFYIISMDFCGPFDVLNNSNLEKRHVLIVVCQQTKAIFVEDCLTLDTHNFLCALSIFMSQNGCPGEVRTDNASCFLSGRDFAYLQYAQDEVDKRRAELDHDEVEEFCRKHGIKKWTLSTPRAAHTNGLAERFVGLFKTALLRVTHSKTPTVMDFRMLIKRCQDIVNSRPLVHAPAADLESSILLTPNHFLKTQIFSDLDSQQPAASTSALLTRFYSTDQIVEEFWTQYQTLMLQQSHKFSKWTSASPNIKLNQLVLVVDKETKRRHWNLGEVVSLMPTKDGQIRNVEVSVVRSANMSKDGFLSHIKKRNYERHVSQLIPLDLCTTDSTTGSFLMDLRESIKSSL